VVVAAPFYIHSATAGFRLIDDDQCAVAYTLGASPWTVFFKIVLPMARPSLLSGLGLAWARAIGEFGATLIFAGNLSGHTQTMPLAIYAALDQDVRIAIALSLILTAIAMVLLLALRSTPTKLWQRT
jgi:molybdate transport system permease protein